MAQIVDGKIILGVDDMPLINVLRDVAARNAERRRRREQAEALKRSEPPASPPSKAE
jgi:hypothetical protein